MVLGLFLVYWTNPLWARILVTIENLYSMFKLFLLRRAGYEVRLLFQ